MNNDVNSIAQGLEKLGFKEAKQQDVLGYVIPYCWYLSREYQGQHQYVWLVSYNCEFVEAVIEVFLVPRNSRAKYNSDIGQQEKMGYRTLHCGLARDLDGILVQLGKTYPDYAERKKTYPKDIAKP